MEVIIILIGIALLLLGFIGILLPIIPSTPLGLAAILLLHFSKVFTFSTGSLLFYSLTAILILLSDYILPALGAKKYGGTKYGMIGATIGGLLPLVWLPVSGFFVIIFVLLGTYIGAYAAEYLFQSKELAHRAAIGSVIGFIWTFLFKFIGMTLYSIAFVLALICHYKNAGFCGKILIL